MKNVFEDDAVGANVFPYRMSPLVIDEELMLPFDFTIDFFDSVFRG